jgi:hypothetical protein
MNFEIVLYEIITFSIPKMAVNGANNRKILKL